jgi:hypothetical protein
MEEIMSNFTIDDLMFIKKQLQQDYMLENNSDTKMQLAAVIAKIIVAIEVDEQ